MTTAETARYWEDKAKAMDTASLFYAIRDLSETMAIYKDSPMDDPYVQKLHNEWDACVVEMQRRRKGVA